MLSYSKLLLRKQSKNLLNDMSVHNWNHLWFQTIYVQTFLRFLRVF
ncbi:protein of unknown function [Shewanella benthica]|uniref:Uncharacterized protein n=1 Tax=Shewanella benthica TaxID=43661 RepID=A0A330M0E2_9GAMM|nr:protein of unknown function [Shewanella benthica]